MCFSMVVGVILTLGGAPRGPADALCLRCAYDRKMA